MYNLFDLAHFLTTYLDILPTIFLLGSGEVKGAENNLSLYKEQLIKLPNWREINLKKWQLGPGREIAQMDEAVFKSLISSKIA